MQLEWDGKIGPATIVGVVGSLTVLVTIGIAWGSLTGRVDSTTAVAAKAETASKENADRAIRRDQKIAEQSERLGKIETSITFIVPALQRIEGKLDLATSK